MAAGMLHCFGLSRWAAEIVSARGGRSILGCFSFQLQWPDCCVDHAI